MILVANSTGIRRINKKCELYTRDQCVAYRDCNVASWQWIFIHKLNQGKNSIELQSGVVIFSNEKYLLPWET